MKRILILAAAAMLLLPLSAQRTSRKGLKTAVEAQQATSAATADIDTIVAPTPHTVDINGYDKPLRSRRESFFATNNAKQTVCGIAITINYYDSDRRQLHQAKRNIVSDIPAGETRQLSFPSWDSQQSFYYVRSAVPRRAEQATPYDVAIAIDTLFVK